MLYEETEHYTSRRYRTPIIHGIAVIQWETSSFFTYEEEVGGEPVAAGETPPPFLLAPRLPSRASPTPHRIVSAVPAHLDAAPPRPAYCWSARLTHVRLALSPHRRRW